VFAINFVAQVRSSLGELLCALAMRRRAVRRWAGPLRI
jgi:hypothetical protein